MLDNLPDDPKTLKEIIFQLHEKYIQQTENNNHQNNILAQQSAVIDELNKQLRRQTALVDNLQHQLKQLLKRLYGRRSDKLSSDNLPLFPQEEMDAIYNPPAPDAPETSADQPEPPVRKPSSGHGRKPFPAHLRREDIIYDIPPDDKVCGQCDSEKKKIGEEISEQLEYVPADLVVKRHIRPVYACPKGCDGELITAPVPSKPIEKGIPGPGLLAHIVIRKFQFHDPLNRQAVALFDQAGINIGRSTLSSWMAACADLIRLLVARMTRRILLSHRIHTDDTPVVVLEDEKNKRKTGRLWAYIGDDENPYIVYDYTPNRRRDGPKEFLKDYECYLQADAYSGYDRIYSPNGITEVACWAHTRRYFVESQETSRLAATEAVAYIRRLYDAEDAAKIEIQALPLDITDAERINRSADIRLRYRQTQSVGILADLYEWLTARRRDSLPKSPLGKAVSYALKNWDALKIYTTDGQLAIDNNAAERAMRPVALGRKNYLFFGSDKGGETAARLYSLIESAKRHGLNAFDYLRDVFDRLPNAKESEIDNFLPDRWKMLRQAMNADVASLKASAAESLDVK